MKNDGGSMKASAVYLRAAEMIANEEQYFACHALLRAGMGCDELATYFKGESPCKYAWLTLDDTKSSSHPDEIDFRVLALCLMSAIAADEERAKP